MNIFFGFIWKTKKADKSLETKHIRKIKKQQQQTKEKTNKQDKNIAMSKQPLFIKYMTVIVFCKIYLQTYLRI